MKTELIMIYWLVRIGYAMLAANIITVGTFSLLINKTTLGKENCILSCCVFMYVLVFTLFFNHFK